MPPATPQPPADSAAGGHVEHPPVGSAAPAAAAPKASRAALPPHPARPAHAAPAFARTAGPATGSVTTAIPGVPLGGPMPPRQPAPPSAYAALRPTGFPAVAAVPPHGATAVIPGATSTHQRPPHAATVPFARPVPTAPAAAPPQTCPAEHAGPATIPASDRFGAAAPSPAAPRSEAEPHTDGFAPVAGSIGPAREVPAPVLSPEDAAANRVLDTLMRLGHRVRGVLDARFAGMKMTDARYMALRVVQDSAPEGCTQAKLAAALGQCESSVSTLVERMRTGKLVYRLHPKSDRRKRVLLLTDLGREALEHAEAARAEAARELCENLSGEEREGLCDVLGRLLEGVRNSDAEAGRRRKVA